MSDRRHHDRPDGPDRRSFPRPPLWLNLLLLLLGIAGIAFARYHRERVSREFSDVITREQSTPADVTKIKEELSEMDLNRESLKGELEWRMKFVGSLKSENFYLSIDTKARKLRFYYGDTVLRQGDLVYMQDPHFEHEMSTEDGCRILFVQYQGPTTGVGPVYEGRFDVSTTRDDDLDR